MIAMNYLPDLKLPLYILGANSSNLYVVPTTVGITLNVADLIGSMLGGEEVTILSVKAANKYAKIVADGQVITCPNAVTVMTPNCKSVPPKNDAVPSPSTIFGVASVVSQMCVGGSLAEAFARMNAATAPTGFWLLDTGEDRYVTVEVGIDP